MTPDPTRLVADADVLAADLFVGGPARAALDCWRRHSWMTLVASDVLLAETRSIIAELGDDALASAWIERMETRRHRVEQAPEDHPGLASAAAGDAAHLLSFEEALTSVATGAALRPRVDVSVRQPAAFVSVFDPERLYPAVFEEPYPGPDRDPRG